VLIDKKAGKVIEIIEVYNSVVVDFNEAMFRPMPKHPEAMKRVRRWKCFKDITGFMLSYDVNVRKYFISTLKYYTKMMQNINADRREEGNYPKKVSAGRICSKKMQDRFLVLCLQTK